MLEKGELVVYGEKGICEVDGTTHLELRGADKNKLYYILIPLGERDTKIYCPVDNEKVPLRRPMNKNEAMKLIEELPELSELAVPQEKLRKKPIRRRCVPGLPAVGQHAEDPPPEKKEPPDTGQEGNGHR